MVSAGPEAEVVVAWAATPDATDPATRAALELTGRHPGPLHHHCPTCGSIEHGRPSFDAPVAVSVTHPPGLTVVAVSTAGPVGIDAEPVGAADLAWVRAEAVGKAHGIGIVASAPESPVQVVELEIPGYVAALAVLTTTMPAIRMRPEAPEAPASPARP